MPDFPSDFVEAGWPSGKDAGSWKAKREIKDLQ